MQNNFLSQTHPHTSSQTSNRDNEIIERLVKDDVLVSKLQFLYFKMQENNPGERFIRQARPIAKQDKNKSLASKLNALKNKKVKSFVPKLDKTIKSANELREIFIQVKDSIEPNEIIAKMAPHPIVRIGMVEEEVVQSLGRLRLNSFKKNK